jgi:hypothetical protein
MMKPWQQISIIVAGMVLTLWAYTHWVIGAETLSQPAMRMRFSPAWTDPGWVVLILLLLLVLAKRWLVPHLMQLAWIKQHPSCLTWLACAILTVVWLFIAFSAACDYAFYFGNTWEYHEMLFGFVLLEPKALGLALVFTVICWLSLRRH